MIVWTANEVANKHEFFAVHSVFEHVATSRFPFPFKRATYVLAV